MKTVKRQLTIINFDSHFSVVYGDVWRNVWKHAYRPGRRWWSPQEEYELEPAELRSALISAALDCMEQQAKQDRANEIGQSVIASVQEAVGAIGKVGEINGGRIVGVVEEDGSEMVVCDVQPDAHIYHREDLLQDVVCLNPKPATITKPLERECEVCGGSGKLHLMGENPVDRYDCSTCNGTGKETWILVRGTGLEPGEYCAQIVQPRVQGYGDLFQLTKREA